MTLDPPSRRPSEEDPVQHVNLTKAKLAAGEPVFGCFFRYPEATLAEFVALQGWDFLVYDAEHGSLQPRDVEHLCRAAELHEVTPITRVTTNDPSTILRYLDAGSHGIHVPWVNRVEGVRDVVTAAKYGPEGQRGFAGSRAARWGMHEPLGDYTRTANRETLVVVHVETAVAVDAIEDYVCVDGVDVLFLGPADLSHSLGYPGEPGHPDVVAALERAAEVVAASDKTLGIYAGSPEAVDRWAARGARYFTTGFEELVKAGTQPYLSGVRAVGRQ
jgi:4-hydroxy-2-oxoheptanedioate aldolase